ncbi:hypothetical protein NPIL_136831, partial [Nephila pilipes]
MIKVFEDDVEVGDDINCALEWIAMLL